MMKARSWAVIGAGPCGIASIGRLVDKFSAGGRCSNLYWIDPTFTVGRMGAYYRQVPANTLNSDLIYSLRLCKSFHFDEEQRLRIVGLQGDGTLPMIALAEDACHPLLSFVHALEDATKHLKAATVCIPGQAISIAARSCTNDVGYDSRASSSSAHGWRVTVKKTLSIECPDDGGDEVVDVDAIIYCSGGSPVLPLDRSSGSYTVHSMDQMVDPHFVNALLAADSNHNSASEINDNAVWVEVGASHSGMLVAMNLVSAGFKNVICMHKNGWKFHHFDEQGVQKCVVSLHSNCAALPIDNYFDVSLAV